MPRIILPPIPSNELAPRMRLAQKLRAAIGGNSEPNDRKGELYEIAVGLRVQQYGWLREGFQIGRDALRPGEPDQKIYIGNREVEALLRRGLDRRWHINQAKATSKQGGTQLREAIEFTLVDQVDAATEHRNAQLAGLVYAEPGGMDQVQRKVADNVMMLLREREFSAATHCTRDHLAHALELNCQRAGMAVSEATKTLDEYVRRYEDFPVAAYRTKMFDDVRKILGVSVIAINPPLVSDERVLAKALAPELTILEKLPGK
jgi:hypothetical protein